MQAGDKKLTSTNSGHIATSKHAHTFANLSRVGLAQAHPNYFRFCKFEPRKYIRRMCIML